MSDYYADTLDTLPLFRRSDPDTSKAAGTRAREFLGEHERRILEALAVGPGTKDELAHRCGLTEQQVARRMAGMKRRGLVRPTLERGISASGCTETVYEVIPAPL